MCDCYEGSIFLKLVALEVFSQNLKMFTLFLNNNERVWRQKPNG